MTSHDHSEAEQHLQETSNNLTGDHVPKFLHKLNIGRVYIVGDTLIHCKGDTQTLHSVNEKNVWIFSDHSLPKSA